MELFQEYYLTALLGLVFACVVAKFVSVSLYGDDSKVEKEQVKVELDYKRLRVRGAKSNKRVKFADDVVFKHVDYYHHGQFDDDVEEEIIDSVFEITSVVEDDICDEGCESTGIFVEVKGEIFTSVDQVDDQREKDCNVSGEGSERIVLESMKEVIIEEKSDKGEVFTRFDEVGDDHIEVKEDIEVEDVKTDVKDGVINRVDSLMGEDTMQKVEGLLIGGKMDNAEVPLKSGVELDGGNDGVVRIDEKQGGLSERDDEEDSANDEGVIDDDWEGIESTDLEKRFGEAVNYVECKVKGKDDQLVKLGSDVQMQLYGLHKIAVEGPCRNPQPMALNFSARAKWNAWQKLGSMNPEAAMEEYIKLVSENIPSLGQNYSAQVDGKQGSSETTVPDGPDPGGIVPDTQPNIIAERELESSLDTKGDDPTAGGTKTG